MTTQANLYVNQGVTFSASLELTEDDGDSYEITNQQFFCSVKRVYSSTPVFSANVTISEGSPTNDLTLTILPEHTADLEPGKYQYDVIMLKSSGEVEKILEGLMFILPTVTRLDD